MMIPALIEQLHEPHAPLDQIAGQLMDLIAGGQLAPGQRLPSERDLCKEFGVGRTSLREGLRSLVAMGILEARVGEGTFVRREGGNLLENALQRGLQRGVNFDRLFLGSRQPLVGGLAGRGGLAADFVELRGGEFEAREVAQLYREVFTIGQRR